MIETANRTVAEALENIGGVSRLIFSLGGIL